MTAPPNIHTYHCICTALLLASTHILSALPRRAEPSLDHALILPLPPLPPLEEADGAAETATGNSDSSTPTDEAALLPTLGYTILLSVTPDRKATIVRREDGFEKRYLYRCGRCRLVVAYELDEIHYSTAQTADAMDVDTKDGTAAARAKTLYILPGGVMSTDAMASGKNITEGQVIVDNGRTTVAAWE